MNRLSNLLTAAILLVAGTAAAPPPAAAPADSPAVQAVRQVYADWDRYRAQSSGCGWSNPRLDAIMERDALMQRRLGALESPRALLVEPQRLAPVACGGPVDNETRNAAALTAWKWLVRMDFHTRLAQQDGWTKGLLAVDRAAFASSEPLRAAVEQQMVTASGQPQVDAGKQGIQQEVVTVLNAVCAQRRPGNAQCPKIPATLNLNMHAAKVRAEEAEAMSRAMAEALAREQRGEVGMAYRLSDGPLDRVRACTTGDVLIYPNAPDRKPGKLEGLHIVTLHRQGTAAPIGTATIQPMRDGSISVVESEALGLHTFDMVRRSFIACQRD